MQDTSVLTYTCLIYLLDLLDLSKILTVIHLLDLRRIANRTGSGVELQAIRTDFYGVVILLSHLPSVASASHLVLLPSRCIYYR